jgi:cysteinyl-tRNA synthetase
VRNRAPFVFNTLTQNKVEFVPKNGNVVKWYICGPTVYDSSHLGHARTYVAFDMIRRVLSDYFGYDIFCVMNITDIDDKIILRARRNYLLKQYRDANPDLTHVIADASAQLSKAFASHASKTSKLESEIAQEKNSNNKKALQGELDTLTYKRKALVAYQETLEKANKGEITQAKELLSKVGDLIAEHLDAEKGADVRDQQIFRDHAAFYENEFLEDMQTLGVRLPDTLTRVTEYVPEIVDYIQKIMDNGFAYEAQGSVYFDIREYIKTHSYRKLSFTAAAIKAALDEGEGALASTEGKRCEYDFALWKNSKDGEPAWESPWGQGRPGWHIECSVMASDLLGDTLDIHGGGVDLCFPHHDNELAQAEAYYGHQQWVNYFLHSGHLNIGFQKMSKSLKNFFTIREILKVCVSACVGMHVCIQAYTHTHKYIEAHTHTHNRST